MDETELIINAVTLCAKDLIVDSQNKTNFVKSASTAHQSSSRTSCSLDDDLDLFVYCNLMKNKRKQLVSENQRGKRKKLPSEKRVSSNFKADKDEAVQDVQVEATKCEQATSYLSFVDHQFVLDDDVMFEKRFKFSRKTFKELVRVMSPCLPETIPDKFIDDFKLPKSHIVLIGIWILTSTEPLQRVADNFKVSKSKCEQIFNIFCELILSNKNIFIRWPGQDESQQIVDDFSKLEKRGTTKFPNIVGVIGCTDIAIPVKLGSENNPANVSMKLQSICDSRGIFLDCYAELLTSVPNEVVLGHSQLLTSIEHKQKSIHPDHHIIGDKTYPLRPFLMVPYYKQGALAKEMQLFNEALERNRRTINVAFKLLKKTFLKLKCLDIETKNSHTCLIVACALHNFCIRQNDAAYFLDFSSDSNENRTNVELPPATKTASDFLAAREKREKILSLFLNKSIGE